MAAVPKPLVKLSIAGRDVTADLDPHHLAITYEDKLHGEADELEVELRDDLGLWRGPWRPEHGTIVEAWFGYEGRPLMPAGRFEVDEPEAAGGRDGDSLTFRALSAAVTSALRTKRTKAYENQPLSAIAGEVAGRNGLSVVGTIDDVAFQRVTQRRERDLQFLQRLAEDSGHYFTVKGQSCVFTSRAAVAGAASVRSFDLAPGSGIVTWRLKEPTHRTYSMAKAQYLDPVKKQLITVEAEDLRIATGDTLNLDERVEDEAQARRLASSRLAAANDGAKSGSFSLVGDETLVAGQVVELGATFGQYAGRWLIQSSRHRFTRGGYTTDIELKGADA